MDSSENQASFISIHDEVGVQALKAVNEHLCCELSDLHVENQSLKKANQNIQKLLEKMYSIQRNTNKKKVEETMLLENNQIESLSKKLS